MRNDGHVDRSFALKFSNAIFLYLKTWKKQNYESCALCFYKESNELFLSPYNQIFWERGSHTCRSFVKLSSLQQNLQIDEYDLFIVLTETWFTENIMWTVSEVKKAGVDVIFVRSKVSSK